MPYLAHFGLNDQPFPLTPNTQQFFATDRAQEILASLEFGIRRNAGLMKVVGDIGTGKTLLCRLLLRQLGDTTAVAYLNAPQAEGTQLIALICQEFSLPADGDRAALLANLNAFLIDVHAQGREAVLVVDEAQSLGAAGLETIRLLSNLETENHKLLQIILFGQEELDTLLTRKDLRQVMQRIAFAFSTGPFSVNEGKNYILHRLHLARQAGVDWAICEPKTLVSLVRASAGVPRIINILADKALLAAYADSARTVTPAHVRTAVRESRNLVSTARRSTANRWAIAAGLTGILIGSIGAAWSLQAIDARAALRSLITASDTPAIVATQPPVAPEPAAEPQPSPPAVIASIAETPKATTPLVQPPMVQPPKPVVVTTTRTPVPETVEPAKPTAEAVTPPVVTPPVVTRPAAELDPAPTPARLAAPATTDGPMTVTAAPPQAEATKVVSLPVLPEAKPEAPAAPPPVTVATVAPAATAPLPTIPKPVAKPAASTPSAAPKTAAIVAPPVKPVAAKPTPAVPKPSAPPVKVSQPAPTDATAGQPRQGKPDKDGRWVWQ